MPKNTLGVASYWVKAGSKLKQANVRTAGKLEHV